MPQKQPQAKTAVCRSPFAGAGRSTAGGGMTMAGSAACTTFAPKPNNGTSINAPTSGASKKPPHCPSAISILHLYSPYDKGLLRQTKAPAPITIPAMAVHAAVTTSCDGYRGRTPPGAELPNLGETGD